MNMTIEETMNMPIAEMKDTDLRVLTDNELDDVNGGRRWFEPFMGLGVALGYYTTRYLQEHVTVTWR